MRERAARLGFGAMTREALAAGTRLANPPRTLHIVAVPTSPESPTAALARWHQLLQERDAAALDALLADDATFHSPIVHTPQAGKAIVARYLTAAMHVLANESFHYVREVVTGNDAVLEFVAEVDGIVVNGVDMIRFDDDGKIADFKVMVRPLKAVHLVHQKMAAMLGMEGARRSQ